MHEKNFQIMIFLADIASLLSDYDDFDNDEISWKFAQRYRVINKTDFPCNWWKKGMKKWGWSCRQKKTWYIFNNYIVTFLQKNWFHIWICPADMAFLMSNFHDSDKYQISWVWTEIFLGPSALFFIRDTFMKSGTMKL